MEKNKKSMDCWLQWLFVLSLIHIFYRHTVSELIVDQFPNADKAIKSKSRSTPPGTANLQMQTDVTCSKINIAFLTPFLRCICPDD